MVLESKLGQPAEVRGVLKSMNHGESLAHIERLESAFFQISSRLSVRGDLDTNLEHIVWESLECLRSNRSTLFIYDPRTEVLKCQFSYSLDPRYQQTGLVEELEVAKKALRQSKPLLLVGRESISEFFKYEERENRITSLMSIPLLTRGSTMGVLSTLLINGRYDFDERSLRLFSSFANVTCIAVELAELYAVAQAGKDALMAHEGYLDDILSKLHTLSDTEQEGIQIHSPVIQEQIIDDRESLEGKASESVYQTKGTILLKTGTGAERRKEERIGITVPLEFEEEYWCVTGNLSRRGAFVLTENPMDLEDEFSLRIHLPDKQEPVEAGCKVIWTNKYGKQSKDLQRGMGVKFLRLQPKDQIRIEEFIKACKSNAIS